MAVVYDKDVYAWKIRYGEVYNIHIDEYEFVFRRLTIAEHRKIIAASRNDCELEDNIVREALLYPDYSDSDMESYMSNSPAMVLAILAGHILESSLLGTKIKEYKNKVRNPTDNDITSKWEEYLEGKRRELIPRKDSSTGRALVDDPITPLMIAVSNAFPSYKPEELMALPLQDLLDRVVWAELKMGTLNNNRRERTMPQGLSGNQRQSYLENMSAEVSDEALKKEMRMGRARARS